MLSQLGSEVDFENFIRFKSDFDTLLYYLNKHCSEQFTIQTFRFGRNAPDQIHHRVQDHRAFIWFPRQTHVRQVLFTQLQQLKKVRRFQVGFLKEVKCLKFEKISFVLYRKINS